jgi:hypothetical protein
MKITKSTLKKIIKEEVNKVLSEAQLPNIPGREKFTDVVQDDVAQAMASKVPGIYRKLDQKHKDAINFKFDIRYHEYEDLDQNEEDVNAAYNAIYSKLKEEPAIKSAIRTAGGNKELKDYIYDPVEAFEQMKMAGYFYDPFHGVPEDDFPYDDEDDF